MARGGDPWGHSLVKLLSALSDASEDAARTVESARALDKLYIVARYPNGFSEGAPADYFDAADAQEALSHAERVHDYCRCQIPPS